MATKKATNGELIVEVACRGRRPGIMFQPMPPETLDSIRRKAPASSKRNVNVSSEADEAKSKLYTDGNGNLGFPVRNLWACLVGGGEFVKANLAGGGRARQLSTGDRSLLAGILTIKDSFIILTNGNGSKPKWVVDKRAGKNKDGGANCLIRPKIVDWGFRCTIVIDTDEVSEDAIKNVFLKGGKFIGLCEHRKKGRFGRFDVVGWKPLKRKSTKKNGPAKKKRHEKRQTVSVK